MNERGRDQKSAEHSESCVIQGIDPLAPSSLRCEIWGVLNVTPDSFSDGGAFITAEAAATQVERLLREGADVVDVGGESSRPRGITYGEGAAQVEEQEELRRVMPALTALAARGARVSVDTVKPAVARAALAGGARIVNDVSCGQRPELLEVAASAGAELVLMHTRGRGECSGANVEYRDVVPEVRDELLAAVARAEQRGVRRDRIWIDPGIGFAKTARQSLAVLAGTPAFVETGLRVLVGPSRKSFIAELARDASGDHPAPGRRLGGTAAAVTMAVLGGAHAVRVHDVAEMRQAAQLALALRQVRS